MEVKSRMLLICSINTCLLLTCLKVTSIDSYLTTVLSIDKVRTNTSVIVLTTVDNYLTYAAVHYQRNHKNVVYIDCSQVKSKQKLIRKIAKSFGVGSTGKYDEVYEDLVFYLKQLSTPLIILDEAGDLHYEAFLEIKKYGYSYGQTAGTYDFLTPERYAELAREAGITICGTHYNWDRIVNDIEGTVKYHQTLGTTNVGIILETLL